MLNQKPIISIKDFDLGVQDDQDKFINQKIAYGEGIDVLSRPGIIQTSYVTVAEGEAAATDDINVLLSWCEDLNDLSLTAGSSNGIEAYAYGKGKLYRKQGAIRATNAQKWTRIHTDAGASGENEGGMAVFGTKTVTAKVNPTLYWAIKGSIGQYYYDQAGAVEVYTDAFKAFTDADTRWHPMVYFSGAGGLCIGDGRYIAVLDVDGVTWSATALTLPEGVRVRSLTKTSDRLIIGTWTSSDATIAETSPIYDTITEVYTWDGTSATYNERVQIPDGVVCNVSNFEERVWAFTGYQGNIREWAGLNAPIIRKVPIFSEDASTTPSIELGGMEVMAGAVTNDEGRLLVGYSDSAFGGIDTGNRNGVWEIGRRDNSHPFSVINRYIPSPGQQTDLVIGFVKVSSWGGVKNIFFSWYDGVNYGVDSVSTSVKGSGHFILGRIKAPNSKFLFKGIKVYMDTLNSGVTGEAVQVQYRLNRTTSWTTLATLTETNQDSIIPVQKRGDYIQFRFNITPSTGRSCPRITQIDVY